EESQGPRLISYLTPGAVSPGADAGGSVSLPGIVGSGTGAGTVLALDGAAPVPASLGAGETGAPASSGVLGITEPGGGLNGATPGPRGADVSTPMVVTAPVEGISRSMPPRRTTSRIVPRLSASKTGSTPGSRRVETSVSTPEATSWYFGSGR